MLPVVAAFLGQGLELAANAVLAKGKEWVQEKTGVDLDKKQLSSEDLLKIKQFEADNEEDLIKLRQEDDRIQAELMKAFLVDRQSARTMQVAALAQSDWLAKNFIYIFSLLWSFSVFVYIMLITLTNIPKDNVRFADTVLGFLLGTVVASIIAFFYGTTYNNRNKDDTINTLVKGT